MAAKRRRSIVGVIPGGTANVWAHEMPEDPVKASLLLVNSEGRKVDLGHVEFDSLPALPRTKERQRKQRPASAGRHHFLLLAGLGIDAAVLRRVSTPLKEKVGEAAVALAAAKELPSQHAFPTEIRSSGAGREKGVLWRGQALGRIQAVCRTHRPRHDSGQA
jgi:diacylglycerol kinase family enzyme